MNEQACRSGLLLGLLLRVWLFVGEAPGRWALPGGLIVVCAAVACASLRASADKKPKNADLTTK
jgi:hypothetical protein